MKFMIPIRPPRGKAIVDGKLSKGYRVTVRHVAPGTDNSIEPKEEDAVISSWDMAGASFFFAESSEPGEELSIDQNRLTFIPWIHIQEIEIEGELASEWRYGE